MLDQTLSATPDNHPAQGRGAVPRAGWFQAWLEVQRKADKEVMAELRRKIGPEGDLKAAYRQWYEEQMRAHDEGIMRMYEYLHRIEGNQD